MSKKEVILVTGVAGFIASHVSEKLLQSGHTILGVDEINDYYDVSYKEKNLSILNHYPNFSFLKLDIRDTEAVLNLAEDYTITKIAHIAARAGVRPSISDPMLYQEVNVRGTLNLLELARIAKVQNFVLTSSSSVYGNSTQIPFKEDDSATDKPISPYAATKKASEVLGHTYSSLYGLQITVVRPFTVYGPRGRPDMAPWLFLKAALCGNAISKFGDGSTRRDYTYIDDFVSGFIGALNYINNESKFNIFNLGNSATVSLNEAIETIEKVTDKKIKINQLPMQPGDVNLTNADISKAKEAFGYDPKTSFSEGMGEFFNWWKKEFFS